MNIILNPGTLAVVILVVTLASSMVTLLFLTLRVRFIRASAHPRHCGHCHSLLLVRGVRRPPETVTLQGYLSRPCLATQVGTVVGESHEMQLEKQGFRLARSLATPTSLQLGETKKSIAESCEGQYQENRTVLIASRFSPSSDINVHSEYPFKRICSTRKKSCQRLYCPPGTQPAHGWLDISQMCKTVLSRISPRSSKEGNFVQENFDCTKLNRRETPIDHNYIYPLNDVERYRAFVLKTKIEASSVGITNQCNQTTRMSWGSTLPEYKEFLV